MEKKTKKIHAQQKYMANSKDRGHRDMCNDIASGRFREPAIIMNGKIVAYTRNW